MRKIETTPEQIKYTPKIGEGFSYALGSWAVDEGKNGEANVLSSPSLFGTWPMVDWCHGYIFVLFTKNLLKEEQKKDLYLQMKDAIDEKLHSKCSE
jgi:hypothetical protein